MLESFRETEGVKGREGEGRKIKRKRKEGRGCCSK